MVSEAVNTILWKSNMGGGLRVVKVAPGAVTIKDNCNYDTLCLTDYSYITVHSGDDAVY